MLWLVEEMKVRDSSQQYKILLIPLTFIVIIFILRGGYYLWLVNKTMLLRTEQLFNNLPVDQIPIPDDVQTIDDLPPSVSLAFGRIAFAQENYSQALSYFEQAPDLLEKSPIIQAELAVALSRVGRFVDAISLYESTGSRLLWNRDVHDAILLAYLHHLDTGQILLEDIIPLLQEVAPQELYSKSLILREQAGVTQLADLPAAAQNQLARFSIEAVNPRDERLLNYSIRILPELVDSSIWDNQRLTKVLQFWIWQYPDSPALDDLLSTLAANYPEAADWFSLQTELDSRRHWQRENTVLVPTHASPNDLPNMLANGSFDTVNYQGLVGWRVADYITGRGEGEPQAAFFMDLDEIIYVSSPHALRVDGIWLGEESGFYGAIAFRTRLEGAYILSTTPQTLYRLSGYYRTRSNSERVSIYMGNPRQKLFDVFLPPTAQKWQYFEHIDCFVGEQPQAMQFLLRVASIGSVWFDELAVVPIDSDVDPSLCTQ
jgi:tetratricopeptide (TPR) repeat protein